MSGVNLVKTVLNALGIEESAGGITIIVITPDSLQKEEEEQKDEFEPDEMMVASGTQGGSSPSGSAIQTEVNTPSGPITGFPSAP